MAVVVFDPNAFRERYPMFTALTDAQLQQAFNVACLKLNNTDASNIPYDPPTDTTRETLLYLLVCHLATLALRGTGVVGTLGAASEGSVNASFTIPIAASSTWYAQTQCGLTYWQLTQRYLAPRYYAYRKC